MGTFEITNVVSETPQTQNPTTTNTDPTPNQITNLTKEEEPTSTITNPTNPEENQISSNNIQEAIDNEEQNIQQQKHEEFKKKDTIIIEKAVPKKPIEEKPVDQDTNPITDETE